MEGCKEEEGEEITGKEGYAKEKRELNAKGGTNRSSYEQMEIGGWQETVAGIEEGNYIETGEKWEV